MANLWLGLLVVLITGCAASAVDSDGDGVGGAGGDDGAGGTTHTSTSASTGAPVGTECVGAGDCGEAKGECSFAGCHLGRCVYGSLPSGSACMSMGNAGVCEGGRCLAPDD